MILRTIFWFSLVVILMPVNSDQLDKLDGGKKSNEYSEFSPQRAAIKIAEICSSLNVSCEVFFKNIVSYAANLGSQLYITIRDQLLGSELDLFSTGSTHLD